MKVICPIPIKIEGDTEIIFDITNLKPSFGGELVIKIEKTPPNFKKDLENIGFLTPKNKSFFPNYFHQDVITDFVFSLEAEKVSETFETIAKKLKKERAGIVPENSTEELGKQQIEISKQFILVCQLLQDALRIHKAGDVYFSNIFMKYDVPFPNINTWRPNHLSNLEFILGNVPHQIQAKYSINKEDIIQIEELIAQRIKLNKGATKNLGVASKFFNMTYSLPSKDQYMKYALFMTVLEALYAPDGHEGEIRFKISVRIAKLSRKFINGPRYEQEKLCKRIKDMYDKRSKVVHRGKLSNQKEMEDDFEFLESICRESLRLYLKEPQMFTPDELSDMLF